MNATRLLQFIASRITGKRLDWTLAAIAFLLAVLPARFLAPWTSDVARIVSVPIVPLMHLGMAARDAIRPPREAFDHRAPEVIALEMQAEAARTLFEQSRLKVESLEREVAALKGIRAQIGSSAVALETATVVGVDPTRRDGLVRLNVGARHGVHRDSVVIAGSDAFAGLVVNDPSEFVSLVRPALKCAISVRLYPADGLDANRDQRGLQGTVLKPADGGVWLGDIASDAPIKEGEIARLTDERYGGVAKGLRVGRVRRVLANEKVPGARIVEVEPIATLADESTVIVAMEPPESRQDR